MKKLLLFATTLLLSLFVFSSPASAYTCAISAPSSAFPGNGIRVQTVAPVLDSNNNPYVGRVRMTYKGKEFSTTTDANGNFSQVFYHEDDDPGSPLIRDYYDTGGQIELFVNDEFACETFDELHARENHCTITADYLVNQNGSEFYLTYSVNTRSLDPGSDYSYNAKLRKELFPTDRTIDQCSREDWKPEFPSDSGGFTVRCTVDFDSEDRNYHIKVEPEDFPTDANTTDGDICRIDLSIQPSPNKLVPEETFPDVPIPGGGTGGEVEGGVPATYDLQDICNQVPEKNDLRQNCVNCYSRGGLWTAVGCISYSDNNSLIGSLLNLLIGMAGGFALIFILFGAFTVSTSASNPERLKSGREMIISAIAGLVFTIFSIILLQTIGVEILQIPGFGG